MGHPLLPAVPDYEAGSDEQTDLRGLRRELTTGSYRSGPLTGFLHQKEGEKVRPLAVPNLRDRIAQRAAVQVLAPASPAPSSRPIATDSTMSSTPTSSPSSTPSTGNTCSPCYGPGSHSIL